jgi:glycerol kinase
MKNYILAIDQGTTGTTTSLVDSKGKTVQSVNKEHRQIYPKPGWVEHQPQEIWSSVLATIQACLKKARVQSHQIAAIGITNQRETVVLWDRKSGEPIGNAIVWQDRRTTEFCQDLKNKKLESVVKDKTGLVIDPYFSASKITWMLDRSISIRKKAEAGTLACGTIDSFLLWRLSGGQSFKTDVSNASRTQLMDLKSAKWDTELLKIFNLPLGLLPDIQPSSGIFGTTRGLKVLPDGIPITGIAGDQQAALFGQACFEAGESKCTFGTGSFLLMNTGTEMVRSNFGLLTTAAWQLKGQPVHYALEGGAFICGAAVQFLRDQMGFIRQASEVEKLAKTTKDSGGVEFVLALSGLGAPHWDPNARGLIAGLTRGTTRAQIARATLEAMALQNADILFVMQKDLKRKMKSVRVDGGAAANNLLMQMQADYLGVEVVRPKIIETTVAGAAYLAGLGVGLWIDISEIQKIWKIEKLFAPKISERQRQVRFDSWNLAVQRAGSL